MSPTKPKPPTQIEVWRTEVQRSIPHPHTHPSFTPTESEYHLPAIAPPSFWKKILRRSSLSRSNSYSLSSRPNPNPNPGTFLSPTSASKVVLSRRSKIATKLKGKSAVEEVEGGRTEMYDRTPSPRRKGSVQIPGEEERGSSMEVGSENCDVESEVAGLKERRERLERAARLLSDDARRKEKSRKEGRADGMRRDDG
ncbi:hypothetical protein EG329_011564 [Mollisiaceae sp. DMI_Dod_QoI]|nr:hypothetical protein EG329_011564 [Helotiales sp. DMI_Dod_QoI]